VPVSGEDPEQAVTRFLSAKHSLLLLDNVEHVLAAARFVSELLSACPALSVLATSREAEGPSSPLGGRRGCATRVSS
jgi:predicted ATPase